MACGMMGKNKKNFQKDTDEYFIVLFVVYGLTIKKIFSTNLIQARGTPESFWKNLLSDLFTMYAF